MDRQLLTIEKFDLLEPGIIDHGQIENSPSGLFMTREHMHRMLIWVAIKGSGNDWSMYVHWANNGLEYARTQGDKVYDMENVKKIMNCDDEVIKRYRR